MTELNEVRAIEQHNYALNSFLNRYNLAIREHDTHPSIEHSLSVIREELHELEKEVFKKESKRSCYCIEQELLDLAVAAFRSYSDMRSKRVSTFKVTYENLPKCMPRRNLQHEKSKASLL